MKGDIVKCCGWRVEEIVSAVPPRRCCCGPKPPREATTPLVVDLLRLALDWRDQIASGDVPSQAAIAEREGVTRARVTQVMGLLRLAPEIQVELPGTLSRG